ISADDTFTRVEPELIKRQTERGGTSMCDVVDMIRKEGFASGERQGFADGERQGFADGRDSLYTILTALQAEGRSDELVRVLSDRSYMEKLLAEQKR
ncbi:MAG: hypothetical protein IJR93_06860, partial [Treponema sp.]|nr:hypothetical protein [Treponema sp.]